MLVSKIVRFADLTGFATMNKITVIAAFAAAIATGLALADTARATSGPGCLVVVNVESWDVLNMRARPSHRSPVVDVLPPGRHGIISLDGACIPKQRAWGKRWCPVSHYNDDRVTSGWVKQRFVRDSDCP